MDTVGFVGLGVMGRPMAINLARAGVPVLAWNRTARSCAPVADSGATIARSAREVFDRCRTVILMLADEQAIDTVLERAAGRLTPVGGRTVVQMGTVAAAYSVALSTDIAAAGGAYVEAPVSGSRGPAETGDLVALLAGEPAELDRIRGLLAPMCAATFACGPVPSALTAKFAVNLFLITMVTGLAESFHFGEEQGLDLVQLEQILAAGPMASAVSRGKAKKLSAGDFDVQASIADVFKNNRLIAESARAHGIASPLLDICHSLFGETLDLGHADADMAAVIHALRARTRTP